MRGCVLIVASGGVEAIAPVLAEVDEGARALGPSGIELSAVMIHDGRRDGAGIAVDAARAAAKQLELPLEIVDRPFGVEPSAATSAGLEHILSDEFVEFVVTLDADGHHDGRQIPDLVRAHLARQSGLTIGSRWTRGGSSPGTGPVRAVLSRAASWLIRVVTGARGVRGVRDTTTSFRVYRPDVARMVLSDPPRATGYAWFSAVVALSQAHGFAIDEVPITFRPRYSGVRDLTSADVATFARELVAVRRHVSEIRREMLSDQALWAQRSPHLRVQGESSESTFAATQELTNLAGADRFLGWINDELESHLGTRVLEVGAGIGAITRKIAASSPEREIVALEPAANLFAELLANTSACPNVAAVAQTSQELLAGGAAGSFDSVVYVSVLEHILDDTAELATARELLRPGGTVSVFVPAMPSLYGTLDFKSGHYRRYGKAQLAGVIDGAGLELVSVRHLDVVGVVPYWLMYRVLRRQALDSASSKVYDSLIVPVSRSVQRAIPDPRLGKNLLAVARRR